MRVYDVGMPQPLRQFGFEDTAVEDMHHVSDEEILVISSRSFSLWNALKATLLFEVPLHPGMTVDFNAHVHSDMLLCAGLQNDVPIALVLDREGARGHYVIDFSHQATVEFFAHDNRLYVLGAACLVASKLTLSRRLYCGVQKAASSLQVRCG